MAVVPFVVGRDRELAAVDAFFASAEALPSVLLLEGEGGMGKTTLWEFALAEAGSRFHVLAARPVEIESRLTFAAVRDLLEPVLEEVGPRLPAPQLAALEAALLLGEPDREPPEPHAVAFAFLSALRALAEAEGVLVAVDDLQWLDPSSAAVLVFAVRRAGPGVRFLLARRSGERVADVAQALDAERLRVLTLAPLSRGAVQRLLRDRLAFTPSRPSLTRIHRVSGGNPLYALELARAHAAGADETEIPPTLAALVDERLGELPVETERALQVAALFARPTVGALTSVLGAEPELEPAIRLGVIASKDGSVVFTHPLLASCLAARIEPKTARSIHGRIAAVVDGLEEQARHLALAADGPDPAAAAALEEAAAQARGRGAPEVAAELLDHALALSPPADTARARLLLAAANAERDAGDFARTRELVQAAIATLPRGGERAQALLLSAEVGVDAVEACTRALNDAGADHALRARIQMTLAIRDLRADVHESFAHARAAASEAEEAGDAALLSEALALQGEFEAACCDGDALATLARASELRAGVARRPFVFSPRFSAATVHMWRDELEPAAEGFAAELAAAEEWGDSYEQVHALMHLAQVEWRRGKWTLANEHASEAWERWQDSGDAPGVGGLLWVRAVVAAHLGELETARCLVDEALVAAVPDRIYRSRHDWLRGFVDLSEGRLEQALTHLEAAATSFRRSGWREPGLRLFSGDLVEARVAAGLLDEAEVEVGELLRLGEELDRPRAIVVGLRGRGMAAAARGDLEAALADLTASLEAGETLPVLFERARTLLALGEVQRRARRRRESRETLGRALELFETLGAPVFAERARAELGRIGGRTPTSGELTPAELRVAELVARGRTNKEVAGDLVVSVHTVEAALTQVYRKLGLRSRAQLARRFGELEPSKD